MPVHRVDGDPLQPLLSGRSGKCSATASFGHCCGVGVTRSAGCDVDDQHRIGLFLHREELRAIGTECDSFKPASLIKNDCCSNTP